MHGHNREPRLMHSSLIRMINQSLGHQLPGPELARSRRNDISTPCGFDVIRHRLNNLLLNGRRRNPRFAGREPLVICRCGRKCVRIRIQVDGRVRSSRPGRGEHLLRVRSCRTRERKRQRERKRARSRSSIESSATKHENVDLRRQSKRAGRLDQNGGVPTTFSD